MLGLIRSSIGSAEGPDELCPDQSPHVDTRLDGHEDQYLETPQPGAAAGEPRSAQSQVEAAFTRGSRVSADRWDVTREPSPARRPTTSSW